MKTQIVAAIAVLALAILACEASATPAPFNPQPVALNGATTATRPPKPTATATPIPTATTGYQATAEAAQTSEAQARADLYNAKMQMVDATSAEADRFLAYAQMTADGNRDRMLVLSWTATAALTAVPATRTQTMRNAVAMSTNQSLLGTSMAMTQQAPTQIVAMADAQARAKYADALAFAQVIAWIGLGLVCVVIAALGGALVYERWAIARAVLQQPNVQPAPARELPPILSGTPVVVHNAESSYPAAMQTIAPCTAEQLTELADRVLQRRESLAINNFEGGGSRWNRKAFSRMRGFLLDNGYADAKGGAAPALTPDGIDFLRGWLIDRHLPIGMSLVPDHGELPEIMSHERSGNGAQSPMGEGFVPLSRGTE